MATEITKAEVLELLRLATMRPFSAGDHQAFSGVESDAPKIGEYNGFTVVQDGASVEVYAEDGDRVGWAETAKTGIKNEAEFMGAIRDVFDDMDTQEVIEAAGLTGLRLETFGEAGLMTSNTGLVFRLPNGAEFQVQIVQSRNARRG